ncbi:uncharacterized protein L3040_008906 [Drepanopeziza brunnea f. sp. 'multigermtubi']|uniref:uncharacterized protein n=1 Tax=Drepanopeziza brunnea f. sp. 'multigermtubi' TaxID=698441 RepID=UPI00238C7417|nr:hypothetical protein L3040_008906 [Drepanopeziza brunnea f. sp. 'multigermtubi']
MASANAPRTPKPITIDISSDDDADLLGKTPASAICIDDDSPRPKKRARTSLPKFQKYAFSSSVYGGSSDDEALATACSEVEMQQKLMRSWVDAGILMAIRELAAEKAGVKGAEQVTGQTNMTNELARPVNHKFVLSTPVAPQSTGPRPQRAGPYMSPYQDTPVQYSYPNSPPKKFGLQGYQASPAPYRRSPRTHQRMEYPPNPSHSATTHSIQPHYATPTSSLMSDHPNPTFSSSAPSQSSPTPQQHVAYHSGKTPKPNDTTRQPLTLACTNSQTSQTTSRSKAAGVSLVLPADQFLSWFDLVRRYCPVKERSSGVAGYNKFKVQRAEWLAKLKMNVPPYNTLCHAEHEKQEVEDAWAKTPSTKRRQVEMLAHKCKYRVTVNVPLRTVPAEVRPFSLKALDTLYKVPLSPDQKETPVPGSSPAY